MRLTYCLFVIITQFISSNVFSVNNSQNISIDSLFLHVTSLPDDSLKVEALNELSYKYTKDQLDTAFILVDMALDISEKLNYEYGKAQSLFQLGLVLRYQSNYVEAIKYSKQSYDLFEKMNKPEEKARVLNSLGNVYKRVGDYKKSVQSFLISLKIYTELKDSVKVSFVMNNLGVLYQEMGEYEKSLDFHMQNLEVRRMLGEGNELILKSLINIGSVYLETFDYDRAIDYYNKAIDLMDNNTSKYDRLLLLQSMGNVYQMTERYQSAEQYYLNAIEIEEEIGDQDMLIFTLQGLGNVIISSGRYNEGLTYLIKAYNLAKDQGNLLKWRSLSESLISAYKASGDYNFNLDSNLWAFEAAVAYKKSLYYHEIYQQLNDSLLNIEKIKQITELEQKYDAEKREQQIAFLEKEQEIQKLELVKNVIDAKRKSLQRNLLIVIVVLAFIFVVFLSRKNKKINEQSAQILAQNESLSESNNTKDRLFQIIAHDLRSPLVSIDSLTQLIPYWVEEQDYKSLKKLSKTMEVSVTNILSLIDDLLNWALSQQGSFPYHPASFKINETIKDAISLYIPIAQIKNIDLKFSATKDSNVFADKNMFLTILRNLLNNAIKFTPEKGKINVGVDFSEKFAKVWVKDSGIGISQDKLEKIFELAHVSVKGTRGEAGKGLGLFFCKEFVNLNQGEIFIESNIGRGSTITFTLPLFGIDENKNGESF